MSDEARSELNELRNSTIRNSTVLQDLVDDFKRHVKTEDEQFKEVLIEIKGITSRLDKSVHKDQLALLNWVEIQVHKEKRKSERWDAIKDKVFLIFVGGGLAGTITVIKYAYEHFVHKITGV